MSVTIEFDLKEVLDKINQNITDFRKETNQRFEKLDDKADRLNVDMATVKTKLEGIEKKLENQEFISRGVLVALIVPILGGFAKLFGLIGNP